jgi:hypothetical protein
MKNKGFFTGLLLIIVGAIFMASITGCDNENPANTEPKVLTVTGLTTTHAGAYYGVSVAPLGTAEADVWGRKIAYSSPTADSVGLYASETERWTGIGTYDVFVYVFSDSNRKTKTHIYVKRNVSITETVTPIPLNTFTAITSE